MITREKKLIFNVLRILHVDEDLSALIDKTKYAFISIISYKPLNLGTDFFLKQKNIINIYLTDPIEEIFERFTRSTKLEIKKTYQIQELEFVMDDKNLEGTYNLYKQFEYSQGRVPWKKASFDGVKLFNAYYNGELISSIPCYNLYPYLQARAMFSKRIEGDKQYKKIVGHATRRLVLDICQYAKTHNYLFFGLGSINFESYQKSNVSQFKGFFGGVIENEYTYIYKNSSYKIFEKLLTAKARLKKLFRI